MSNNFFHIIMEAEGDLIESFDGGNIPDEEPTQSEAPVGNDDGSDDPPPMNENDNGDLSFSPTDDDMQDDMSNDDEASGDNPENAKMSDKVNNILNQQLYEQMKDRNDEIDSIIENLQTIAPVLPFDVVKSNDVPLTKIKAALLKGKNYVINDFVDNGYGENLLYFKKLDSLYTLLLNQIDSNLKKIKND